MMKKTLYNLLSKAKTQEERGIIEEVFFTEEKQKVCGNCLHSILTNIDGLVDCQCDGYMKDDDMPCNIDNFEFK